jgi:hypothetical protein
VGYRWAWDDHPWEIDWTPFVREPAMSCCERAYAPGAHTFILEVTTNDFVVFSYAVAFKFI